VINIQKQIQHWKNGAGEDWQVAQELVDLGRTRHSIFFAHLALEKTLKAHICQATGQLAPRIHPLLRLAERTRLKLSQEQLDFLARFAVISLKGAIRTCCPRYQTQQPLSQNYLMHARCWNG